MRNSRGAAVLAAVATGALVLVPGAAAKTRVVKPGHSIQAAIDKSKSGDVVEVRKGTYKEALQISKDGITLAADKGAVLTQPANPPNTTCSAFSEKPSDVVGICIVGDVSPPSSPNGSPTVNRQVRNVHVTGLTVKGFSSDGVLIFGAKKTILKTDKLLDNGDYGAFSNTSQGTRFVNNDAIGNHAPGLYVGDSPHANSTIRGNEARDNLGEGVLLRNATGGHVKKNILTGNCAGLVVLADAPGPAGDWMIDHNAASQNNRQCPGDPGEGEPPVSGLGIALVGAHDTTVESNALYRNRKKHHKSFASGGIVVSKGVGGTPPRHDLVQANALYQNSPFDISWDGSGSHIKFRNNQCSKSKPGSICG